MKSVSASQAKHRFGQLIIEARAEPVVVEKHGRPVVVVLAVEEYQRLIGMTVEPWQDAPERRSDGSEKQR